MTLILFRNTRIVTPTNVTPGELLMEDGVISQVRFDCSINASVNRIIDVDGRYPFPGFVDIHAHDMGGADFMGGTLDAICQMYRKHMERGTTLIMPTTTTNTKESLLSFVDLFSQVQLDREDIPNILGLYLEGPYLAYEQCSAQDPEYLHSPDLEGHDKVLRRIDRITHWLFIVGLNGADLFLHMLREYGIINSLTHSDTTCPQVFRAYENGISALTHFYSTIPGMRCINAYRIADAIEVGYLLDNLFVEVVADGKYLPAELLQLIYKIKGPERICLVIDSIHAADIPDSSYILGNRKTSMETIVEDGVAELPDRSALAGDIATISRLVRTMLQVAAAPLHETVKVMVLTPARPLRTDDHKDSINRDKDADLLLFDEDINAEMTLVRGHVLKEN